MQKLLKYDILMKRGDIMALGKRCSLCGGKLNSEKRCMECGLDNTKNDDMYKNILNRNTCDDKPLTHVHEEPVVKKRDSQKRSKSERTKQTKKQAKVTGKSDMKPVKKRFSTAISIIVVFLGIIPSIFNIISSGIEERTYESYGEVMYTYETYFEPGMYTVGVHIPEGTYDVEIAWGEYGFLEVLEYTQGALYTNDFYYMDVEEEYRIDGLYLHEGEMLKISTEMGVLFTSDENLELEIAGEENPLTEHYVITGEAVAGLDFPAGVYDIYYIPGYDGEHGNVGFTVWSEEKQTAVIDDVQYFDSDIGETVYRNLPLTAGSKIWLEDLQEITLMPSDTINPQLKGIYKGF